MRTIFHQNKYLEKALMRGKGILAESKPVILNLKKNTDRLSLSLLLKEKRIQHISDDYEEELRELFAITNPALVYTPDFENKFKEYRGALEKKMPLWQNGRWVYFPWISALSHILEDEAFQIVRTARNRNLITEEEQKKFYDAIIGIAGLSVGNSVALAVVLQGGARHIKLADHDRLALSNINRIRAGAQNLGLSKTEVTAREIYTINPYAKVELFSEGLNEKNISRFFTGPPKLDIVIDEIDNLAIKYLLRVEARKHRLPLLMAADNGDNAVIDIERYDLNPKLKFFHGRMGNVTYDQLAKLDKFGVGKMITKHIGPENVTERMQESLVQMGKTIVSWPQLGGAALMNGSAVAYAARRILNNQPLESNRAIISLDEKFISNYNSSKEIKKRKRNSEEFKKIFGL